MIRQRYQRATSYCCRNALEQASTDSGCSLYAAAAKERTRSAQHSVCVGQVVAIAIGVLSSEAAACSTRLAELLVDRAQLVIERASVCAPSKVHFMQTIVSSTCQELVRELPFFRCVRTRMKGVLPCHCCSTRTGATAVGYPLLRLEGGDRLTLQPLPSGQTTRIACVAWLCLRWRRG